VLVEASQEVEMVRGTSVWWQKPERVSRAGVLWISATGIRKGSQH